MKIIKRSLPTIIWILFLIISNIILSNSDILFGQYKEEAWEIVKKLLIHSIMFWGVIILTIIQTIILNLKPFKYKTIIIIILTIIDIIFLISIFNKFIHFTKNYMTITYDTNGNIQLASMVFSYRKEILIYIITSFIISIINMIQNFIVKNKGMA